MTVRDVWTFPRIYSTVVPSRVAFTRSTAATWWFVVQTCTRLDVYNRIQMQEFHGVMNLNLLKFMSFVVISAFAHAGRTASDQNSTALVRQKLPTLLTDTSRENLRTAHIVCCLAPRMKIRIPRFYHLRCTTKIWQGESFEITSGLELHLVTYLRNIRAPMQSFVVRTTDTTSTTVRIFS